MLVVTSAMGRSAVLALGLAPHIASANPALVWGKMAMGVDPLPVAAMIPPPAPVAELVDAPDSKSGGRKDVLVRVPARGTKAQKSDRRMW